MIFTSLDFFFFFLAVFSLRWLLPRRLRNPFLLAASVYFYASWDWRFVFLLLALVLISYSCGLLIPRCRGQAARRGCVLFALASHVGVLAYFKYSGFFLATFEVLRVGAPEGILSPRTMSWIFPLGLSYYTFQSLGYVLDVYKGESPEKSLVDYSLFVSFFPQLPAGPISRARNLLPQLKAFDAFQWERFQEGCFLIAWGFFQKVFIADNLAPRVNVIFHEGFTGSGAAALLGVYAFALQLFCDFSGYSDMARGLGKCLGFDLPLNFNLPFFATDMRELWKRWHISLSDWLDDFVYKPLMDSRYLPFKLYAAPLLTMVVMGLWHGAKGTMVLMGFYFGVVLAATLFVQSRRMPARASGSSWDRARPWLGRALTFHLFMIGLLLLRSNTLEQALSLGSRILFQFAITPDAVQLAKMLVFFGAPLFLIQALQYAQDDLLAVFRLPPIPRTAVYIVLLCLLVAYGNFGNQEFFYRSF